MKYHISMNSIYIHLRKALYKGNGYSKYMVDYYSKASGFLIASEKIKISDETIKSWEVWEE